MSSSVDVMWDDNPVNVSAEVNFIWSIANKLRGPYQSDKYKDVIIPMTIIRRFECALEPYKAAVVDYASKNVSAPEPVLCKLSHYPFFNKSRFSLAELVNDADNIAENFKNYLSGFSKLPQEIIASLDFEKQIDKMEKNNRLLSVVKAFSELDLNPKTIDNVKMGYIFEELIRKFSENAEAGDHYTGRDIIKLMVNLLLAEGCDDLYDDSKVITIGDLACGTGGMLSTAYNYIRRMNASANIELFGQEINPESFAICLAEMLIKGQKADHIVRCDSMKQDSFGDRQLRLMIMNPPFGTPWGGKDAPEGTEAAVREEYERGEMGRFPAGLPATGDMQLLFMQAIVKKMDDANGRAAVIENGSPLFTGGVSSGESQIRRWLLDNDYLEAIIALPTDLFYNTGIATYIWLLSKNKRPERRGKVQLINAASFFKPLRKSLGNKRVEISPEDRKRVTELYAAFAENEFSQIHANDSFKYREYTVMQPLQRSYAVTPERVEAMLASGALSAVYDEAKIAELEAQEELSAKEEKLLAALRGNAGLFQEIKDCLAARGPSIAKTDRPAAFETALEKALAADGIDLDGKTLGKMVDGLSQMDKTAAVQKDRKGNVILDKETKDTEIVPFTESVEDYMKREVLPHVPDAVWSFEEDLSKKKPVVKTGAEFPFTRFFYQYEKPRASADILAEINALQGDIANGFSELVK